MQLATGQGEKLSEFKAAVCIMSDRTHFFPFLRGNFMRKDGIEPVTIKIGVAAARVAEKVV